MCGSECGPHGKDRRFVNGQKYTLLSHRDNLSLDGKRSLTLVLAANKRRNTACLLKAGFGQLWDYRREGWERRFFDNRRASLKWHRLKRCERLADMIERHWDGIAGYRKPENKEEAFLDIARERARAAELLRVEPSGC